MMNLRLASPGVLIDLNRIADLGYMTERDDGVAIINAVLDAISPYDPAQLELPLTPERILRLAQRLPAATA